MKRLLFLPFFFAALLAGGATRIVQDQCGPFTDVTPAFCPYILELYFLGVTAGTSATTFSPDDSLTRGQGAVFVAKGLNQALARSSRRAALGQWWTTQNSNAVGVTNLGGLIVGVASDGTDIWVGNGNDGVIHRVRASDGKLLGTWTGALGAAIPVVAAGSVFFPGDTTPGRLYRIDPTQPPGVVETVATGLGPFPFGSTFDGSRIWTANTNGVADGSISIITPSSTTPWPVTTVSTGFVSPYGVVFDGQNVWVADAHAGSFLKLDSAGNIVQTVAVGGTPLLPIFDGSNFWVPNAAAYVSVVSSSGTIVAELTGNNLVFPAAAAFDGERVLVTTETGVSVWRAADLKPLGSFLTDLEVSSACSDGLNFWLTVPSPGHLLRF
ncbi:MAG TPA: S-layer homology domain-containing protein [Thermoanaerobaculia bacterium]|jgi:hypothetical protein